MERLTLLVLPLRLTLCRLAAVEAIPDWVFAQSFWSVTSTDGELSLVVPEPVPDSGYETSSGWRSFKVHGPLDLSLTGVLASISVPLAEAGIPIFAISTFETDYVLVRESDLGASVRVLRACGHTVDWE